jgi:ribosome maturation factor RimP
MNELIQQIENLAAPLLEGTDIFLVGVRIKPVNNIKVYLDADSGFSIEKSILVNRKLYPLIESSGLVPPEDFSLEVSSPGVDEPLANLRQYKKNTGRTLLVMQTDGTEKTGLLKEVTDEHIKLEVKQPKKKESIEIEIPFTQIKKSIVQIIF